MRGATPSWLLSSGILTAALLLGPVRAGVRPHDARDIATLAAWGYFNALVALPGTTVVRGAAVAAAAVALIAFPDAAALVVLLAWFLWLPAYVAGWGLARERAWQRKDGEPQDPVDRRSRIAAAAIIASVAAGVLAYRSLWAHNLQQTAALFVGVPSLIAIVIVLCVSPRSAVGVVCKAVTVGLLVAMVFLEEGILCVLMSAPLFLLVAVAVAGIMQAFRERHGRTAYSFIVLLVVVPLSLEGVAPATTIDRRESITVTKTIAATPDGVTRALFEPPRFDRALPLYLRAGFPMAVSTAIAASADATRWTIRVRGGEMRLDGMEPREGELVLSLAESRRGLVRWRVVSDSSHMTHFLFWREIVVRWRAVGPGETRVEWTLRYDRGLDPAWYFGPWERYAVRLAAGYLIDTVATP